MSSRSKQLAVAQLVVARSSSSSSSSSSGAVSSSAASIKRKPNFIRIPHQLDPYGRTHLLMERQARQEFVAHVKAMQDYNALPAVLGRRSLNEQFARLEDFDSALDDYDDLFQGDYDLNLKNNRPDRAGPGSAGRVSSSSSGRTSRADASGREEPPEKEERGVRPVVASTNSSADLVVPQSGDSPTEELAEQNDSEKIRSGQDAPTARGVAAARGPTAEILAVVEKQFGGAVASPDAEWEAQASVVPEAELEPVTVVGAIEPADEDLSTGVVPVTLAGLDIIDADPVSEYNVGLLDEDKDAEYNEPGPSIHCRKHKGHWHKRRRQKAGNPSTKWRRKLCTRGGRIH
ncbi:unnamed protein product [Amoebophrya sp. A120]|nr:unnamed protein product [Amoebophrya sp. A120]|eukprot:GSA120T00003707001.1